MKLKALYALTLVTANGPFAQIPSCTLFKGQYTGPLTQLAMGILKKELCANGLLAKTHRANHLKSRHARRVIGRQQAKRSVVITRLGESVALVRNKEVQWTLFCVSDQSSAQYCYLMKSVGKSVVNVKIGWFEQK